MTPALAVARAAGATDIGCDREKNEDAFVIDEERGIAIVADGLGGEPAGETASAIACDELLRCFSRLIDRHGILAVDGKAIDAAFHSAHRAIQRAAAADPSKEGMGTTVVLSIRRPDGTVWIAHAGDSRCYLLRDGELRLQTMDDSVVGEALAAGEITDWEEGYYFSRNILTQSLGLALRPSPRKLLLRSRPDDLLLLCSDGLWDTLACEEMELVLRAEPDPAHACRALVERAKQAGGEDNITAVVVALQQ